MTGDTMWRVSDEVLERMAVPGPRYTSYPTALDWSDDFGPDEALAAYGRAAAGDAGEPLSLYVHLPFCERMCLYCGCTVEVHGKQSRADAYLDAVQQEVDIVARALGPRRRVAQMHWGGGTPTFLSPAQLLRLHAMLADAFELLPDAEQSIEVDPHVTTDEQMACLAERGINRVSMGVQDFDTTVQTVVRRDQTVAETAFLIERCRERGVRGINVDLMYGLPGQTMRGFGRTLDTILELRPDRLAVFGYAHVPWMKPVQKVLEKHPMPGPAERARLFGMALERLTGAGWEVIGLDHFALPDDEMALAMHAGTLHRNFMGYATHPAEDMVGIGMSAIGEIAGAFLQNARATKVYEPTLASGSLAVVRGLVRTPEDELRRAAILSVMCRMRLDLDELGARFARDDLGPHFAAEWSKLQPFAEQGLARLTPRRLDVLPTGRLFLRHMAMVFDEHLARRQGTDERRFSKTI